MEVTRDATRKPLPPPHEPGPAVLSVVAAERFVFIFLSVPRDEAVRGGVLRPARGELVDMRFPLGGLREEVRVEHVQRNVCGVGVVRDRATKAVSEIDVKTIWKGRRRKCVSVCVCVCAGGDGDCAGRTGWTVEHGLAACEEQQLVEQGKGLPIGLMDARDDDDVVRAGQALD